MKIGNKVKVTNKESGYCGLVGEVTQIKIPGSADVLLQNEKRPLVFNFNELELVTFTTPMLYLKDRVKVTATFSGFYGKIGTITEIRNFITEHEHSVSYRVNLDEGNILCFGESELKLVKSPEEKLKFLEKALLEIIEDDQGLAPIIAKNALEEISE
jgi:hypothetical protein